MVSLLNGFSQMGSAIAGFANTAGLEEQKSELERTNMILANQLKSGSDIALARVQGEESTKTATATQTAAGEQSRLTDAAKNALPMTDFEKGQLKNDATRANAAMLEAQKPVSGGFTGTFLVPDKTSPNGWKAVTPTSDGPPPTIDKTSNNLSAQTGLSQGAIALMTGQTKGMRLSAAQGKQYQDEITKWGIANGINTSTMQPQVEGAFKVLTQNITRNNQGQILEKEIGASIDNAAPLADNVDLDKVSMANVAAVWAGKQVNDPDAVKVADQLGRLREELAGYNAVAGGHLNDNGTPNIGPNDIHAAEATITNGINSGGLKALKESVQMSADKNKNILQGAIDDANSQFYDLFGAKYHPTGQQSAGGAAPPAPAAGNVTPPATPKKAPSPDIQSKITPESIAASAKARGITEDAVKKELKDLGYTVPQ